MAKKISTKSVERRWGKVTLTVLFASANLSLANALQLENTAVRLEVSANGQGAVTLLNKATGHVIDLTTSAPQFEFKEGVVGGAEIKPDKVVAQPVSGGDEIQLVYPAQKLGAVGVIITTHFFVPEQGGFVRKYAALDFQAMAGSFLSLLKVTLLDELVTDKVIYSSNDKSGQSYPVFTTEYFWGVEFPAASATAKDKRVVLAHMPGKVLDLNAHYRSRDAIIGVCVPGRTKEAFEAYIMALRPPSRWHVNYCSWWTSAVPFSETEILDIIKELTDNFYRTNNITLDSFTIDLGWSAAKEIWQINMEKLPNRFVPLTTALGVMKTRLGIWWSPSNCYSPASFNNEWAQTAGYETFRIPWAAGTQRRMACLAKGTRYQQETKAALVALGKEYNLFQFKCDGFIPECPETSHGHLPGALSREVTAEGLIDIFESLRKVVPDAWIEPCQRTMNSPWWLRHANSLVGHRGNDAPFGVIPAPIYRESYTTSRDFFNMHSVSSLVPLATEDIIVSVAHQSGDPLYNDAVMGLLRGHQFFTLYLNPQFMQPAGYKFLSELITWARANQELLGHTRLILPQKWQAQGLPRDNKDVTAMPRQTYGYAHWWRDEGLFCLRNPWIATDMMTLKLDETTLGTDEKFAGYTADQIYPYPVCLASGLKSGDTLKLVMGPYQTRLIRLTCDTSGQVTDDPVTLPVRGITVVSAQSRAVEMAYDYKGAQRLLDNATILSPPKGFQWQSAITGSVTDVGSKLYYLVESPEQVIPAQVAITINGQERKPMVLDSKQGWAAAQPNEEKTHWKWYIVDLPVGEWVATAMIELSASNAQVSAWVVNDCKVGAPTATDRGKGTPAFPLHPNYQPQTSFVALEPAKLTDLPVERVSRAADVRTIPGVFLDSLEPASAQQGWGQLQKNQSADKKPLVIGARNFLRGIGTTGDSRLVYNLNGKYTTLHGVAGANSRTRGAVVFEFWIDGEKRWQSTVLTAGADGEEFHVPVAKAKTLTVVVNLIGKRESQKTQADLADAWLEKSE